MGAFSQVFLWGSSNYGTIHVFHLLYADDTLLFCKANSKHLCYLCALFLCFEAVSSLKINLTKSKWVPMGNVNNIDGLANILGCTMSFFPMKYFGLLLEAPFKAKSI